MKNTCPLYIAFQVSKVLFMPYCFTLAFMYTSADIIFHNFLELHSTSEKLFFKTPPPPPPPPLPLKQLKSTKLDKRFLLMVANWSIIF